MNTVEEKAGGIDKIIKSGSAIVGTTAGAAAGAALAGPLGAVPGAAAGAACGTVIGKVLTDIGTEFVARILGPREEQRIGATLIYVINKIQKKLAAGEPHRTDWFSSQPQPSHPACVEIPFVERPPSVEIIEGILLAVQREYEEKKLPFMGNLMANIFFDPNIDKMQANLMIKISQRISYRQLCILSVFAHIESSILLRERDYRGEDRINFKLISLLQEISDLWTLGILNCSEEAHLGLTDVNPSKMRIQGMGVLLYNLMELRDIEKNDLELIIMLLKSDMQIEQSQELGTIRDVEMNLEGGIFKSIPKGLRE